MILLSLDKIPDLLKVAETFDIVPRMESIIDFARQHRVLLLRHRESGVNIDINLGMLPFEIEIVKRSQLKTIGELQIRLPSVEDLIIMKAVANRMKDKIDIQNMVQVNPNLDQKRIKKWVTQFATVLEQPELWTDLERILKNKV